MGFMWICRHFGKSMTLYENSISKPKVQRAKRCVKKFLCKKKAHLNRLRHQVHLDDSIVPTQLITLLN